MNKNKKAVIAIAYLIGIIFIVIAIVYWTTPAGALPTFMPGYLTDDSTIHVKHGIASFILGLGVFAYAWFRAGKRA